VALTEAILHGTIPGLPGGFSSGMADCLFLLLHRQPEQRADAWVILAALGLPWFKQHGIKG
jgi:hypothetical protein